MTIFSAGASGNQAFWMIFDDFHGTGGSSYCRLSTRKMKIVMRKNRMYGYRVWYDRGYKRKLKVAAALEAAKSCAQL